MIDVVRYDRNPLIRFLSEYDIDFLRIGCSLLCHATVLLQFPLIPFAFNDTYRWPIQFYLLVFLSLAFSLLIVLRKKKFSIPFFLLRILAVVLMSYPLGKAIEIKIVLLISVLIDVNLGYSLPLNLIFSIFSIVIYLTIQHPVVVFDQEVVSATKPDLFFLTCYGLITVLVTNVLCLYKRRTKLHLSQNRRMDVAISQLMKKNLELHERITTVAEDTVIKERRKISGEIHDIISYTLTNVLMLVKTVLVLLPENMTVPTKKLTLVKKITRYGLNEVRRTLQDMRKVRSTNLGGFQKIHAFTKSFEEATGSRVRIEYGNTPSYLSESTWIFLYHMIQEGLLNAFRHGSATLVLISFWQHESALSVRINDNGAGCEIVEKGIGLSAMEERVQMMGGSLFTRNMTGGFELVAEIPYGGD